ncbi:MAG TPA: hypothetical protein VFA99_10395 [Acidobacteriaceae bacterium]|nr:hypothetical protein [Acidobacteriaceae bacterium]
MAPTTTSGPSTSSGTATTHQERQQRPVPPTRHLCLAPIIDQGARATTGTGCTCQEWALADPTTLAYPAPLNVSGGGIYVHDPNLIQDPSGTFWLYGTHNTLASSTDTSVFPPSQHG